IDSETFKFNEKKSILYKQKYSLNDDLVLGHIGNFTYPKNYPFTLRVFSEIKKQKSNSKLVLIGDGTLRSEVENLARSLGILEEVSFLGIRTDIPDLLQMFDVFL